MYCQKCRKEIEKDAKFCSNCGTQVYISFPVSEAAKPLLVLKPKFKPVVAAPILGIFVTAIGFVLFLSGKLGIQSLYLNLPPLWIYIFLTCILLMFIDYLVRKNTYAKIEYRFYPTNLEYYEGFFTIEEKNVNYRDITEVILQRRILQRLYGLGTIFLSTPATIASGINLLDIENPDKVYRQVKDIANKIK